MQRQSMRQEKQKEARGLERTFATYQAECESTDRNCSILITTGAKYVTPPQHSRKLRLHEPGRPNPRRL
jgi:hypothetical protein